MIVDSRALSLEQAIALANNQPIQINSSEKMQPHDRIALIGIRDSSMPKVFEDSDTVCVVEFADIEPMDTSFIPPEDSEYMKPEHAKKILDFITKWQDKKEKVVLFAHCKHGMCRVRCCC
ncbi:MAG: hypothetical protein HC899_37735 [Leptolyngbyaceae cyanobacterium SM1_4_3]|nr:hypothetical protein [Leptolyngbyaceae cyanobacterium SM1_4_3]